ncbi:MAG: hypothetical protein M1348_00935 [Candidatus Parvarchaeota archaeon]|nr:hypothetical protein [Candidatus Parvarchaeota archaeon]MCL5101162.1 hypothetical protein [Candidatus Parvarchaeota archaeon]
MLTPLLLTILIITIVAASAVVAVYTLHILIQKTGVVQSLQSCGDLNFTYSTANSNYTEYCSWAGGEINLSLYIGNFQSGYVTLYNKSIFLSGGNGSLGVAGLGCGSTVFNNGTLDAGIYRVELSNGVASTSPSCSPTYSRVNTISVSPQSSNNGTLVTVTYENNSFYDNYTGTYTYQDYNTNYLTEVLDAGQIFSIPIYATSSSTKKCYLNFNTSNGFQLQYANETLPLYLPPASPNKHLTLFISAPTVDYSGPLNVNFLFTCYPI